MPNPVRVRGLGNLGIVPDVAPWDLPSNAFSDGMNVRFSPELGVSRAPGFRTLVDISDATIRINHRAVIGHPAGSSGVDRLITVDDLGLVSDLGQGGTELEPIPLPLSGFTGTTAQVRPVLSSLYGNLLVHVPGVTPSFVTPQGAARTALSGWPSGFSAASLRPFGDQLFALNVTDGDGHRPRSLRHSGFGRGGLPTNWDITSTTSGAGEIPLELDDEIIDGGKLGQSFMVYSSSQCEEITRVGGNLLFNRRTLPGYRGIFAPDCFVEVGNSHVTFGAQGIFRHSGSSEPEPLAYGKAYQRIYRDIIYADSPQFLCFLSRRHREIWFCYRTADPRAYFSYKNPVGCNMAAVLNWETGAWTWVDMPLVTFASRAMVSASENWDQGSNSWDDEGGAWDSGEDLQRRHIILTSQPTEISTDGQLTRHRALVLDGYGDQSQVGLPLLDEAHTDAWARRDGLDLDNPEGIPLNAYKHIRAMLPQGNIPPGSVTVRAGGSLTPKGLVQLSDAQEVDVYNGTFVPLKTGGKYLSYEFRSPGKEDFSITGFDLDTVTLGTRM